jgi:hypothetical protein
MNRDYIETFTGKKLWLPNPDLDGIDIEDIAHALAMVPRFAGHVNKMYSVAEHSINVASLVPNKDKLVGLLHDATEAYLCDIPTPFKRLLPQYKELEDQLWFAIATKYGVPYELPHTVKTADQMMLITERNYFKPNHGVWGGDYENTLTVPSLLQKRDAHHHGDIKNKFLKLFEEYKQL